MKLVTSRHLGPTIKDKKNSLIRRSQQNSFITPVKTFSYTDSKSAQIEQTIYLRPSGENETETNKKDGIYDGQQRTQPKNAFSKKCFQKQRTIKPIQDIIDIENSRTLMISPLNYKDTTLNLSKNSSQSRSYSKFLDGKKGMADRRPFNMLAEEDAIGGRHRMKTESRRSLSHSKRIKFSVTKSGIIG